MLAGSDDSGRAGMVSGHDVAPAPGTGSLHARDRRGWRGRDRLGQCLRRGRRTSKPRSTLTPRVRQLNPYRQPVEVLARDGRGTSVATAQGFSAGLERAARRVLWTERKSGGVAQALGTGPLATVQVGDLNARGRRLGATMLVNLAEPRRDLWATVPAYVPANGDSGSAYTPQQVRMHVAVLRDALIDIDLERGQVIALEPGPRSESLSWSPSAAPAPAGAGDES